MKSDKKSMRLFYNCHPGSLIRCPSSLYGGIPILRGEKWACLVVQGTTTKGSKPCIKAAPKNSVS